MRPSKIAIIGMACRFPGARNLCQFWQNLRNGVESVRTLTNSDLLTAGASKKDLANPNYVRRASTLDAVDLFDASFFGISPRDASIMDPQHRHFLECAWESLEDCGHPPNTFNGSTGVFAGSGMNSYLIHNLLANRELLESMGLFQIKQTGNDKDVLATRVSYHFDLRGPSVNVQTACSSSLVAVHLACQSLLDHECDLALAGGVTIEVPQGCGYIYQEREILSRDGRCRPFDAASTGTVFGSGVGVVVLRRLEDALADRDAIRAIILGSAINNDGARKVGYLAPSVDGQAEVIAEAIEFAGIPADDISYVEAHGTGTLIGDPIEVRALTQAFRRSSTRNGFCAIGSVKSNIGHLDAAAGVASLIKTVLALQHAQIPPTLHFDSPNPNIDFEQSPFVVNTKLCDWLSDGKPRRAGVTSLGIGGTNAHIVIEEAAQLNDPPPSKPFYLFIASAKTKKAAQVAANQLHAYARTHPEVNLADVSFSSQQGRFAFQHRCAWVVENRDSNSQDLANADISNSLLIDIATTVPKVAFIFSEGPHHLPEFRQFYKHELIFRKCVDDCSRLLRPSINFDLSEFLSSPIDENRDDEVRLSQTCVGQAALFAIEYSLARWWMVLGIQPACMAGHGVGECVAACLSGVLSLEDALLVVAMRSSFLNDLCAEPARVVSLHDSSSPAIEPNINLPASQILEQQIRAIELHPPRIPYISGTSGKRVKSEEATNPSYWALQIQSQAPSCDCLPEVTSTPGMLLLGIGSEDTFVSTALIPDARSSSASQTPSTPSKSHGRLHSAIQAVGRLWTMGVHFEWQNLYLPGPATRTPLPTYPFERHRFWIEPDSPSTIPTLGERRVPQSGMFVSPVDYYTRVWKPTVHPTELFAKPECWLVFKDACGLADRIIPRLAEAGQTVVVLEAGDVYRRLARGRYEVRSGDPADYELMVASMLGNGLIPNKVVHLWSVVADPATTSLQEVMDRSFFSSLFLVRAMAAHNLQKAKIAIVSNNMQNALDEPSRIPTRAMLLGPVRVIPLELPGISCRNIDVELANAGPHLSAAQILNEITSSLDDAVVAYRRGVRFVESVEPINVVDSINTRVEYGGVYLITGGLGGIGLAIAQRLALDFKATLVLVGRRVLPSEADWAAALSGSAIRDPENILLKKLVQIRSAAGGLSVLQADVTNLEQMRNVVEVATKRHGQINGVFHAAGIMEDGPLLLKDHHSASRVLNVKVRGTVVLEAVLRHLPLRFFVLFSSISAIAPPPGQVDYAAANAFLDAFALSRKGPFLAINWGKWRDIGMTSSLGHTADPLLGHLMVNTPEEILWGGHLSIRFRWLFSEHLIQSSNGLKSLFPGTGYIAMAAQAFWRASRYEAILFQDVFFIAPLLSEVGSTEELRIRFRTTPQPEVEGKAFRFSILSQSPHITTHCTGWVGRSVPRAHVHIDCLAIRARCVKRDIHFNDQQRTRQERQLVFGPQWRSLRRLLIGDQEALAEISLDEEFSADADALRLHPALLDLATGASVYLVHDYEESGDFYLPVSYQKLLVNGPLPVTLFSHIRRRQTPALRSDTETFDITIFDSDDRVLIEIEAFSVHRIVKPGSLARNADSHPVAGNTGTDWPELNEPSSILPNDGVQALLTILSAETLQSVIAVPRGFAWKPNQPSASLPTPEEARSTSASSVEKSVEDTLARWLSDLLGMHQINVDDDFFELGGHSLVGVRLLAMIKMTYQVDLDLPALFEARTVGNLSRLIRNEK